MDFKKTIIAMTVCVLTALSASAQYKKLPAAHRQIADKQMNTSLAESGSLFAQSIKGAALASPFADMYNTAKSVPAVDLLTSPTASKMVNYAARFLGTRYSLGSAGPKAFDCSGFTSYVFKNFGITLSRTSREQYQQGEKVSVNNLRPGDLLFFSCRTSGRGQVGHVAIVASVDHATGTCQFIHASTKKGVTYQKFPDNGYYSRNFIGARRILGTDMDNSTQLANAN
ncbi:MAG: C40 family peptidase [Bacteroides sp.]|nr:C40 family peptidase [Bacteroides sp.]MDE5805642.1 C40 family peptidase [Paramuribaculum sp.]MBD5296848.1 C40 family peptidase [Bacteroides sp.]MBD5422361.1 C40 family peptidase [Bacteroides sp.]MDE6038777.1 C40 family peptidase [Paramuribaculum sp.]